MQEIQRFNKVLKSCVLLGGYNFVEFIAMGI